MHNQNPSKICRTCDNSRQVKLSGTKGYDACPDCTRQAESEFQAMLYRKALKNG